MKRKITIEITDEIESLEGTYVVTGFESQSVCRCDLYHYDEEGNFEDKEEGLKLTKNDIRALLHDYTGKAYDVIVFEEEKEDDTVDA